MMQLVPINRSVQFRKHVELKIHYNINGTQNCVFYMNLCFNWHCQLMHHIWAIIQGIFDHHVAAILYCLCH